MFPTKGDFLVALSILKEKRDFLGTIGPAMDPAPRKRAMGDVRSLSLVIDYLTRLTRTSPLE